jgi:hypothetical protein
MSTEQSTVGIKEAVRAATAFLEDLFPGAKNIRLEEVDSNSDAVSVHWSVVLSFKSGEPSTLATVMGEEPRLFKTVTLDESGTPVSLKHWKQ